MHKLRWIGAFAGILATAGVAQAQSSYEIWNYYAAGSELAGMNALLALANQEHPDVKFVSRIIPGNVIEMRRQLEVAFLGGKPPSAYQSSMASELKTFVDGGRLHPITDVWAKINGDKIFPEGVQRVAKINGTPYGIPYDFSLINNVFYNTAIFKKLSLTPPTDWDSFVKTCDALKAANIEPLANAGGTYWSLYDFYAPLLSTVGVDGYYKIASGQLAFDSPEFRKALDLYKSTMVHCFAKDWSGKTWTQSADDLINGRVGMDMMGIWAAGYMEQAGFKPGTGFDSFPAPGTDGKAVFQMDLFAVPQGTPDAASAAAEFLETAASTKGQQTFALAKGSLAPNVDVDPSVYDPAFAKFATELRTASKANAVLPNLVFLLPTDVGTELGNQIEKFSIDPSDANEKDMITTLEAARQQAQSQKAYVTW
jgi:ABC-type glycerol-3-phosphate transport system substrate-binding protein